MKDDYQNSIDLFHEIFDTINLVFCRRRYKAPWSTWNAERVVRVAGVNNEAKEYLFQILSEMGWLKIYENRFPKDWSISGFSVKRNLFHHPGLGAEMFVTTRDSMVFRVTMRKRKLSSPATPS